MDKFIKSVRGDWRAGFPNFSILHDILSTPVAFLICNLSISFETLLSSIHEKLKRFFHFFVFPNFTDARVIITVKRDPLSYAISHIYEKIIKNLTDFLLVCDQYIVF